MIIVEKHSIKVEEAIFLMDKPMNTSFKHTQNKNSYMKLQKKCNSVLEIGTYMGHSSLIMLLANPKMKLTTIDISNHLSFPATETLKHYFPEAEINFIHGNSLEVIPTLKDKYDMFHLDGNHDVECIVEEFTKCKTLSNSDTYKIVFDDWHGERGPGSNLEKFVLNTSKVEKYEIPNCLWTNSYFEINLK
jgi:hypothetical protein